MTTPSNHTSTSSTSAAALLTAYPQLNVFTSYTDSELCDPKQLFGLEHVLNKANNKTSNTSANNVLASDVLGYESNSFTTNYIKDQKTSLGDGVFIADSRKVIDRAFAQAYQPFAGIMDASWLHQNQDLVEEMEQSHPNVPFVITDTPTLQAITGYHTTKGPLMAFYRKPLSCPEALLEHANHIAIFENINNYTNMGALFRSAAALNVDAVFITPTCYDPLYRRGLRVSMGAALQVPWTRLSASKGTSWTESFFPLLHQFGFTTFALALTESAYALDDPRLPKQNKSALILGNEGAGLEQITIDQSDYAVIIPMAHSVDSLNVACASSVAFWEFCRR